MFYALILTFTLANAVVLADQVIGRHSFAQPAVVDGLRKLNKTSEFMTLQQTEDSKAKAELQTMCKNELSAEKDKQSLADQGIQSSLKRIGILEGNLKTYGDESRDATEELALRDSKATTWKHMDSRTGQMKTLVAQQHENFHAELQAASDAVNDFVGIIKEMRGKMEKKSHDTLRVVGKEKKDVITLKEESKKAVSIHAKMLKPLVSILEAISSAKAKSLAHINSTSLKSHEFRKLMQLKVDNIQAQINASKKQIADLKTASEEAKTEIASLRAKISDFDKHLRTSRNMTAYFEDVCQAYLAGFDKRKEHREEVQKETRGAMDWFHEQMKEVEHVMDIVKEAESGSKPAPPPPPPPPSPPRFRKVDLHQKALMAESKPEPARLTPRFQRTKFRFVPEYTNHQDVIVGEPKLKDHKEDLAKQLSDEFNNQLQSERNRFLDKKRAASFPVGVGYKVQGGAL